MSKGADVTKVNREGQTVADMANGPVQRVQPWPETLALFTGERSTDASAVADYFQPLNTWLTEQNRGETCGW